MARVSFRADLTTKTPDASQPSAFAANTLSCVVCMTNIDILTNKSFDLIGRAAILGNEILAEFQAGAVDEEKIDYFINRQENLTPFRKELFAFHLVHYNTVCSDFLKRN